MYKSLSLILTINYKIHNRKDRKVLRYMNLPLRSLRLKDLFGQFRGCNPERQLV